MAPVILLGAQATGYTVVIDGVTYRPVAVDSSGRLILIGSGAGGAVLITAVDLDIRNLAKAQDELYAVLKTDAGAAYDARDRSWTVTETVPVSQSTPDNLRTGNYGYYSGAWQRQPLPFGFSAQYRESKIVNLSAAGTVNSDGTAVPANTLRALTSIQARDTTSVITALTFQHVSAAAAYFLMRRAAPAADVGMEWQGQVFMLPGDQPRVEYAGVVLNDNLRAYFEGYDMTLNL